MDVDAKNIWKGLVGKYADDDQLAEGLFNELYKKYAAGRVYHTWQHIESLLRFSSEYSAMLQDKEVVDFSIFYHDVIYNTLRSDNEHRSAVFAEKRLRMLSIPEEKIAAVELFIEATKTHNLPGGYERAGDLAFFLDFDMAILGAEPSAYKVYTEQVRKEYRLIPAAMYKAGRKKFLEACLQANAIFHSSEFRSRYEQQARQNIQQELTMYQ